MKDDARPVDYTKTKTSALQQLASGGDVAAVRELERRGIDVTTAVEVTKLDYAALRTLVLAWNDGVMPADRDRSRALARQAQAELEVRYRVDAKLWDGRGVAPQPPPMPPWEWPRPPRCVDWQRPTGSKLYPSETDRVRAQVHELAREVYRHK